MLEKQFLGFDPFYPTMALQLFSPGRVKRHFCTQHIIENSSFKISKCQYTKKYNNITLLKFRLKAFCIPYGYDKILNTKPFDEHLPIQSG